MDELSEITQAATTAASLSLLEIGITAGAIAGLLVMSGFFSGSETALTATSRARMLQFERDGRKRAVIVNQLTNDRERLIGAILLGNNLVNILATALATSLFTALLGNSGVALATLVMTVLVLIFAEVLPKTWAIMNPERAAMFVAPMIRIAVAAFAPFVMTVRLIVTQTLALVTGKSDDLSISAHEEIRGTIDLHHQEQTIVKQDRDMLGGILDLKDLTVDEVMVHRKNINMLDIDLPADEIVDQVITSVHTRIPFWEDNQENIIGILHAKDILKVLKTTDQPPSEIDVRSLLTEPWFVPETTTLTDQLRAFQAEKRHFALVIDEYGALMGLVTLEDILEEIVGDILDEHDPAMTGVRPQPNGTVNVDGFVTIRDLNRAMEWDLPDEEANTIAGLVIHEAQTIPSPGQQFSYYGYRFEILRRFKNQITAIRITPPRTGGASPMPEPLAEARN